MNEEKLSKRISELIKEIEQAKADYAFSEAELTRCEQLTQDYLHKLELEGPGYHECARIARDISQWWIFWIRRKGRLPSASFSSCLVY